MLTNLEFDEAEENLGLRKELYKKIDLSKTMESDFKTLYDKELEA